MNSKRKARVSDTSSNKKSRNVTSKLNSYLFDEKNKESYKKAYTEKKDYMHQLLNSAGTIDLSHKPFTHCVLKNFVDDSSDFVENLQKELLQLNFVQKNNDLYKFLQSKNDLKSVKTPYISSFRDLVFTNFKKWLEDTTSINLDAIVDMSCAQYNFTDVLLCHDDELEGRRIAFIYYLVPETWNADDGGALELFDTDDRGEPFQVVKSIVPARNSLAFFEVTPGSFHQVAEVLNESSTRLSISGWFHGKMVPRPEPHTEVLLPFRAAIDIEEDEFFSWINPAYLDPVAQADIQEKFEEQSEIQLQDFLQKDKYEQIKCALENKSIWTHIGPPIKRRYWTLATDKCPEIVSQCLHFLQSDAFFLLLSNLTGLKLHELAPDSDDEANESGDENGNGASCSLSGENKRENKSSDKDSTPCCHCEVRKWDTGSYTLAQGTDRDTVDKGFALDALLYIACDGWEEEFGGTTSYIASGEKDELLSISPADNALSLVYREEKVLHFVKYLNAKSRGLVYGEYYDISCTYYE